MKMFSILVILLIGFCGFAQNDGIDPKIIDCSVMVQADDHIGSGVVFKNKSQTFVWTDAHVVAASQSIKKLINLTTGEMSLAIGYSDVEVVKVVTQGGKKIGQDRRLARIIRYSKREDIALLYVYEEGWLDSSTTFPAKSYLPKQGASVWHVGSPTGPRGMSSVVSGTVSFVGRLRNEHADDDTTGRIYDQVQTTAVGGCSGGGVFLKNGVCLGLMAEFLLDSRSSPGMMCITPTRRLWEFSERNKCLWAMDVSVETPQQHSTVTDDNLEVVEVVPPPMKLPDE